MRSQPSHATPEKLILTRLFTVARHLRFVRGLRQGLRWFALGSLAISVALIVLWNWDRLPGAWQWLASAGRPRELLWLPLLLALGGFASRWLVFPPARETAHHMDRLRQTDERLLTAVDWILSEKPRTAVSERLLCQTANELGDEPTLRRDLRRLETVPLRAYLSLMMLACPVALLVWLPPHVGLPDTAAVWLGTKQVERLTETLLEHVDQTHPLVSPEEKLRKLLEALEKQPPAAEETQTTEQAQQEFQRALNQVQQMAKMQESARKLLETLAERARQGESLSPQDRQALAELQKMASDPAQQESLRQAEQEWADNEFEAAAQQLQALQQDTGRASRELQEMASQGEEASEPGEPQRQGQEFDEAQGDQHLEPAQQQNGRGANLQPGGDEGTPGPSDFGLGTTEHEELGAPAAGRQGQRQSERTSDKLEEFRHLHEPLRVETATSQTRVRGELSEDGPRQQSRREGRGAVSQTMELPSGGTLLEYREQAENALLREEIPADYRDHVRLYFEALD